MTVARTRAIGPLWRKAPLVLFRFRGLFVALTGGATLLAFAAAAPPLFVSSVASNALRNEAESMNRYAAGISFVQNGYFAPRGAATAPGFFLGRPVTPGTEYSVAERNRRLARALDDMPAVGDPIFGIATDPVLPSKRGSSSTVRPIRLVARSNALAHVERLEGGGAGVWLADTTAEAMGVRPGERIYVGDDGGLRDPRPLRVAGIYRSLHSRPNTPYWSAMYNEIYPQTPDAPIPEVFAIADETLVVDLAIRLGLRARIRTEWPLASTNVTLAEAERIEGRFRTLGHYANEPDHPFGHLISCEGCFRFDTLDLNTATSLPDALDLAHETVAMLRGPADLVSTAGLLVALAVLAAAGAFSIARRRVESGLLFARGMSASAVGAKAAVESLLPVVLGALVGFGVAYTLVASVGPGHVAGDAVGRGAQLAALTIPVGIAALGLVAGLVYRRQEDATHGVGLASRLPWEIGALALAAFFFYGLESDGAFVGDPSKGAARPSIALLLFPFFFIAGGAGLAARGLPEPLRSLRRRSGGFGPAGYLAVRRVAGATRLSLLLMVGCAVALGILVYAQAVVRSLDRAVVSKSLVSIGSDASGGTSADREIPSDLPYPATVVIKMVEQGDLDGVPADVLAIDPATFADASHWEGRWASASLPSLVERLERDSGDALAVVVTRNAPIDARILEVGGTAVPLEVVARAEAFPGMFKARPLVVASRPRLAEVFEAAGESDPTIRLGAQAEVWVKGENPRAAQALAASSLRPFPVLTAEEARETPAATAVRNTFAFLNALGIAAGLLTVVAILLHVQARQRSGVIAHALGSRMGLTNGQHRTSLALEVAAILLTALVVGGALALLAARLLVGDIDPRPTVPPAPDLATPWIVLLATAAILVVVAALGGALAHAVGRRARIAEVLRAGE